MSVSLQPRNQCVTKASEVLWASCRRLHLLILIVQTDIQAAVTTGNVTAPSNMIMNSLVYGKTAA